MGRLSWSRTVARLRRKRAEHKEVFEHDGWCPLCGTEVTFRAENAWFRDYLLCSKCGSIPRERALFKVITDYFPKYRELSIHESSPAGRGASVKLDRECRGYTASQFYSEISPGQTHSGSGYRCENLEGLTFSSNSFDLFITQDVMEHVFNPERAFREIARVLKPGGAHIFTAPLVNKAKKSERWASLTESGEIRHHGPAEYHGNPVDKDGALVTMHWGYDIVSFIMEVAKTPTIIVVIDDLDRGIRAEYIEVLISFKP